MSVEDNQTEECQGEIASGSNRWNLEKQYLWEGHIFYSYVTCQKKREGKKHTRVRWSLGGSSSSSCAQCWGLLTTTTNTNLSFKSQHWKLDVWEEGTFGDLRVCSFKQPLVQKMSMKMNSWLKLHEFYCLHEIAFIVHVVLVTFFWWEFSV